MATDSFGRRIDYLRISVTDRCNLRCVYCMPHDGVEWKAHDQILSFEEIERFASAAVQEGISKIRLTGGEPLVRNGIIEHVARLKALTGLEEVAITTNGVLLPKHAAALAEAGLLRVNISIDSLDPAVYERVTRGGKLADALAGLDAAFDAGMGPVKLNVVVVRSLEQDLLGFAKMTMDRPVHVRFIEYMPIGADVLPASASHSDESWTEADHVPSDETLAKIGELGERAGLGKLEGVSRESAPGGWGPARYYHFPGSAGTIGVISPLSHHFCKECNRLRLTADGRVRTCLFSDDEIDAREVLRTGSDEDVRELIREALHAKPESHNARIGTLRRMSQIGG